MANTYSEYQKAAEALGVAYGDSPDQNIGTRYVDEFGSLKSYQEVGGRVQPIRVGNALEIAQKGYTPVQGTVGMQIGVINPVDGFSVGGQNQDVDASQALNKQQSISNDVYDPKKTGNIYQNNAQVGYNKSNKNLSGVGEGQTEQYYLNIAKKFGNLDAESLFQSIKQGDIVPSKTNPAWTSLYQNGQATPVQVEAYKLWDQYNQNQILNGTQDMVSNAITKGTAAADKTMKESIKTQKEQDALKGMNEEIANMFDLFNFDSDLSVKTSTGESVSLVGNNQPSALQLYKDIIADNPSIKQLEEEALDLQSQIEEINAAEIALESDIRKEVEGEASQSYIQALAAKRAKDLYPRKYALQSEFNNIKSRLDLEKQRSADLLKYTLHDEEQRYNRAFDLLQLQISQSNTKFSQEFAVQQFLTQLPKGRKVTVNGIEFEGSGEDENINAITITKPDGAIHVVGINKQTGEIAYDSFVGKGASPRTSSVSATSQKDIAQDQFWTDYNNGKIVKVGTSYYYKDNYDAYNKRFQELYAQKVSEYDTWFDATEDEIKTATTEAANEAGAEVGLVEIIKP